MFLKYVESMIEFLNTSPFLIVVVMAIVEYTKKALENVSWYRGWIITVFAFVVAFLAAIPVTGFVGIDVVAYIFNAIGLGLVATGVYKIGSSLLKR